MNTLVLLYHPFGPYPFILLNRVLSSLAALRAPVIIMSQGRQEADGRLHAKEDYPVNLITVMDIHPLHKKIDPRLVSRGQRLLKIRNIMVDLMGDPVRKR